MNIASLLLVLSTGPAGQRGALHQSFGSPSPSYWLAINFRLRLLLAGCSYGIDLP
jgi:hypothetical protein